jgi:hypothetical protein
MPDERTPIPLPQAPLVDPAERSRSDDETPLDAVHVPPLTAADDTKGG